MSLIMRQLETSNMCGDPHQSKRLLRAFLAWTGKRSCRKALIDAGIPTAHGESWIADRCVLRKCEQDKLTEIEEIEKLLERIP